MEIWKEEGEEGKMSVKYRASEVCVPVTAKQMNDDCKWHRIDRSTTDEMLHWPRAAADAAAGYVLSNADTWRLNSGPKKTAPRSFYSNWPDRNMSTYVGTNGLRIILES